jgi:alkyl hydroperoxide reductase subunit AhpF
VEAFGVDKIPATVVMGERDYGIRFYGIPSGYEFASLVEAIVAVSQRDSGLSPETREKLRRVNAPVHIQVLVTPT